ncbi:MAG: hypothetical protein RI990_1290 [Planctomycetota bacterium]|jgi:putative membrane protein
MTTTCRIAALILATAALGVACVSAPKASEGVPEATGDAAAATGQPAAAGQAGGTPATTPMAQTPPFDPAMGTDAFLDAVARADLLQMSLGRLALRNASDEDVRDYGQRMLANHRAIQVILGKIAQQRGISLPTRHNEEARATVNRFTPLKGKEFDEALMWFESEEQPKMLAMYRWQYENCTDAAVKQFVSSTMPIIGTHQRMADAIHQEVNKEGIRIAAERKAAELKAEQERQAAAAAEAAAATAKRSARRFGQKKGATMVVPAPAPAAPAASPTPSPDGSAAPQPAPGAGST